MASLQDITVTFERRPCLVRISKHGRPPEKYKALWHRWTHDGDALVELETGFMTEVRPVSVEFLDSLQEFAQYYWPPPAPENVTPVLGGSDASQ